MSLESKIDKLIEALDRNTAALSAPATNPVSEPAVEAAPPAAPAEPAAPAPAEPAAPAKKGPGKTEAVQATMALLELKDRDTAIKVLTEFRVAKAGELKDEQIKDYITAAWKASGATADDFKAKMAAQKVQG